MRDPLSRTFAALSDPTRRAMLARLSEGEPFFFAAMCGLTCIILGSATEPESSWPLSAPSDSRDFGLASTWQDATVDAG